MAIPAHMVSVSGGKDSTARVVDVEDTGEDSWRQAVIYRIP